MGTLNPLDWTAGPFLMLYAATAGITLLAPQAWKGGLGRPVPDCGSAGLGVLHLAHLAGGVDRAAKAALVGLFETRAAVPDRKRRVVRIDPSVPVPPELQPFRHMSGARRGSRASRPTSRHAGAGCMTIWPRAA